MFFFGGLLSNALLGHEEWNEQDELDPGVGSFDSDSYGYITIPIVYYIDFVELSSAERVSQHKEWITKPQFLDSRTPALSSYA